MGPDDGRASHPYDQERAEKAVRELLLALGEDPEREGLKGLQRVLHVHLKRTSKGYGRSQKMY